MTSFGLVTLLQQFFGILLRQLTKLARHELLAHHSTTGKRRGLYQRLAFPGSCRLELPHAHRKSDRPALIESREIWTIVVCGDSTAFPSSVYRKFTNATLKTEVKKCY